MKYRSFTKSSLKNVFIGLKQWFIFSIYILKYAHLFCILQTSNAMASLKLMHWKGSKLSGVYK